MEVVNLEDKFGRIGEQWSPKILARLNDYHVKAVKLQGEFVWHKHDDTDELFLVTKGALVIRLRDREVTLGPGELRGRAQGRRAPAGRRGGVRGAADRAGRNAQHGRCRRPAHRRARVGLTGQPRMPPRRARTGRRWRQRRLADTELLIQVEEDRTIYGEEVTFGGGKVIRDGMACATRGGRVDM